MKYDTSPLFIGMQNDEVRRLHEILRLVGADLPTEELREAFFGDGTRQAVTQFQESQGLPATGIVDAVTASNLPRVVRGQVRRPNGAPLADLCVRAFDSNLREKDKPLGETVTDESGLYRIQYSGNGLGRDAKQSADLIVRVEADGGGEPLAASPTIFDAGLVEIIDLTVDQVEDVHSEYVYVKERLDKVLKLQGMSMTEVQADELNYLAGASGLDPDIIRWLVAAESAEQKTGIPAPAFYAFFRQKLPIELPALLRHNRQVLGRALLDSFDNSIIPDSLRDQLDVILAERLPEVQAEELLKEVDAGQPTSLGDLLDTMPDQLPSAKKLTLAKLLVAPPDGNDPFWNAVRDKGFSDAEIGRIQATLMLGALTQNHAPLVHALQERFRPDNPMALRSLVKLDEAGWQELVAESGVPSSIEGDTESAKRKQYVEQLLRSVEELYPTATIAARLDIFPMDPGVKPDLERFFQKNPEFELGRDLVLTYLEEGGGAIFDGIDPNNIPRLKEQLLPLERVAKISKRPREASLLLHEGFDSAYKIVSMGRRDFFALMFDKLDGDTERVETIYATAEQNVAMSLALLARYSQTYNNTDLAVVPAHAVATPPAPDPAHGIADMRTLFGNQGFCTCGHCQSVYSPAAYLVDLLQYLAKRNANGKSLKDVLSGRRPDLVEIELTCENTDRRMPYVDLVNEILEQAVAPVVPREVKLANALATGTALDGRRIPAEVEGVFTEIDFPLSEQAKVIQLEAGARWLIEDVARRWSVELRPAQLALQMENGRSDTIVLAPASAAVQQLDQGQTPGEISSRLGQDERFLQAPPSSFTTTVGNAGQAWTVDSMWNGSIRQGDGLIVRWQQMSFAFKPADTNLLINVVNDLDAGALRGEFVRWLERVYNTRFSASTVAVDTPGQDWTINMGPQVQRRMLPVITLGGREFVAPLEMASVTSELDHASLPTALFDFIEGASDISSEPARLNPANFQIAVVQAGTDWGIKYTLSVQVAHTPAKLALVSLSLQTSATPEELAAEPEHTNMAAYNRLAGAVYPWRLPFSLPVEEARVYLEHLGVSRHRLMETLHPADRLTDHAIALEYLGLTQEEAGLIAVTDPPPPNPPPLWKLWGFPDQQVQNFPDLRAGVMRNGAWSDLLKTGSIFLQQSGLAYVDILNLLQMRYITAKVTGQPLNLTGEECNPAEMAIIGLNEDILARIPRFVRLWRHLGWLMHDLDRAIASFPGGEITADFILWLSHIQRLRTELNVSIATALSWWSNLDTFGSYIDYSGDEAAPIQPLYDQLFLNRTVVSVLASELEPNRTAGELKYLTDGGVVKKITDYKPAILAGLSISSADLARLLAHMVPDPDPANPEKLVPLVGDELNLKNLSKLYRIASLTRALGLTIRDWLALKTMTGRDPFPGINATARASDTSLATLNFVEDVAFVRISGFSIAELDYLLLGQRSQTSGIAPEAEQIALILDDIRRGLQDIATQTSVAPDHNGERVRKGLALLEWPDQLIDEALGVDLLSSSPRFESPLTILPANIIPAALEGKVSHDAQGQRLISLGALRQQERDDILAAPVDWTLKENQAVKKAVQELYQQCNKLTRDRVKLATHRLQSFILPTFAVDRLTTDLAALPAGLSLPGSLPKPLKGLLLYNANKQQLHFRGLMTTTERDSLLALPGANQSFQDAIGRLYVSINFPPELTDRFYYARMARELRFVGWMTELERQQLRNLASLKSFQDAIDELHDKSQRYQEQSAANRFLTRNDGEWMFYDVRSLAERYAIILQKLMPYLRDRLSRNLVIQKLAQALGLEVPIASELLIRRLSWPDKAGQIEPAIAAFLDPLFAFSNLNDRLVETAFRAQFSTFLRLHKVALLLIRLQVRPEQMDWLFPKGQDSYGLDKLPLQPVPPDSSVKDVYDRWRHLVELFRLRDSLPAGALALAAILEEAGRQGANAASMHQEISRFLNWNEADLAEATTQLKLKFPDDYRDPVHLGRLKACFELLNRLGTSADHAWEWAQPTLAGTHAAAIRRTVRARFDRDGWLERARPLRDRIREQQRQALVEYLVAKLQVRDANDLFGKYLIDVEMDPCMLTSRIKQAISSVQLFVQRCLMSLEKAEGVSPVAVDIDQWNWMKNYRVWEANRKVFVYPENWIEPELRDDKTPFFTELESELLQGDVTADKAEQAFRTYLEKLDEVARLEIVGMYQESEKDAQINVLHVFGRTFSMPHVYYYRRWVDASPWVTLKQDGTGTRSLLLRYVPGAVDFSYWTAWERVDLDLEGDYLIPVVWKRQLYLFWPILKEKARELETVEQNTFKKPDKEWEIQLAWSEYRNGRWSAKKISPNTPFKYPEKIYEKISWEQVFARNKFFFKGLADEEALRIWCYGPAEAG